MRTILLVIKPLPSVSFTMPTGKGFLRTVENLLALKDIPMQEGKIGPQKRKKTEKISKFYELVFLL
jgi:hypothetical protein